MSSVGILYVKAATWFRCVILGIFNITSRSVGAAFRTTLGINSPSGQAFSNGEAVNIIFAPKGTEGEAGSSGSSGASGSSGSSGTSGTIMVLQDLQVLQVQMVLQGQVELQVQTEVFRFISGTSGATGE